MENLTITCEKLQSNFSIINILTQLNITVTHAEAKRLCMNNAVRINGNIALESTTIELVGESFTIEVGKKKQFSVTII